MSLIKSEIISENIETVKEFMILTSYSIWCNKTFITEISVIGSKYIVCIYVSKL